jgi:hypothetical protein
LTKEVQKTWFNSDDLGMIVSRFYWETSQRRMGISAYSESALNSFIKAIPEQDRPTRPFIFAPRKVQIVILSNSDGIFSANSNENLKLSG